MDPWVPGFSFKCHYDLVHICYESSKSFLLSDTWYYQIKRKKREIWHHSYYSPACALYHDMKKTLALFTNCCQLLRHFTPLILPSLCLEFAFSLQFLPESISISHGSLPASTELGKSRPWPLSGEPVNPCWAQTYPINVRGSADTKKGFVLSLSN